MRRSLTQAAISGGRSTTVLLVKHLEGRVYLYPLLTEVCSLRLKLRMPDDVVQDDLCGTSHQMPI